MRRKKRQRPRTEDARAFEQLGLELARTCFTEKRWLEAVLAGWFVAEKERSLGRRFTRDEATAALDETWKKLRDLAPTLGSRA